MEITGYVTVGLLVLGMLVEITPIKLSPLNYIGKHLNKSTNDRLDRLEEKIKTVEAKVDWNDIDTIRQRILSYDALIRKGEHLKQYQYKAVFSDIDKWINYHSQYPTLNGMIDVAIENIKETYKKEKFE